MKGKGKQPAKEDMESSGEESNTSVLPAKFQEELSTDDDSDSNTVCGLCIVRDPPNSHPSIIFWIDCSNCGAWFHTLCALGDNSRSSQYICSHCL